eukprot:TRINITY_DN6212_c0_g1_i1.p1 TRINITY_DN6212_c0_g1~~TRINITY_DN6212_c0_g1_i1.p1  ORF type:complete len:296 (+),score=96.31 TRINITY_DN6212_c0_g1_i1:22-888(+)
MLRRNTRLRREYLYRKSLEGKEREQYEKKRAVKKALEEGKPLPKDLKNEASSLLDQIHLEGGVLREPTQADYLDSEYARAGLRDPKIVVTTARSPSSRLKMFTKEVAMALPNAQKINRGGYVLHDLVATARNNEMSDLVILHEHRGEPDGLVITHLPFGPTAYFGLHNCVLRHDVAGAPALSQAYPHLIFDNFATKLGERVMTILRYLFPVPREETHRVITFANRNDYISFRHHTYKKDKADVVLSEIGPRFEMRLYQIKLGTVDDAAAENEWVLHSYINSSKNGSQL